jgi:hypothetical protein
MPGQLDAHCKALQGTIKDLDAMIARDSREIAKQEDDIRQLTEKHASPGAVEGARAKLKELQDASAARDSMREELVAEHNEKCGPL